jgi:hypothetical protein
MNSSIRGNEEREEEEEEAVDGEEEGGEGEAVEEKEGEVGCFSKENWMSLVGFGVQEEDEAEEEKALDGEGAKERGGKRGGGDSSKLHMREA